MFSLFSRPAADPIYKLAEMLILQQREQQLTVQKQLEVLQTHLEMFKTPAMGPDMPSAVASEDDLMDSLELAAELGNPEAAEVIADPDRLREYIRHYRASV